MQALADEIRIFEDGPVIATHPAWKGAASGASIAGHRSLPPPANSQTPRDGAPLSDAHRRRRRARSLDFYDAVGRRLAAHGAAA